MRLLCDRFDLKYKKRKFPEYYNLLNENNILSIQSVFIPKTNQTYFPFMQWHKRETPFWWKGYNDTKHDLPNGLKEGNIKNTINALAGLYALHCMCSYAQEDVKDFFERNHWYTEDSIGVRYGTIVQRKQDARPDSEFFYSFYLYNKSSATI